MRFWGDVTEQGGQTDFATLLQLKLVRVEVELSADSNESHDQLSHDNMSCCQTTHTTSQLNSMFRAAEAEMNLIPLTHPQSHCLYVVNYTTSP